jgi:hypothetical protein
MSIRIAFINAVQMQQRKGWDYLYVAVDVHDTVLKANYSTEDIPREFCKGALRAMQLLTMMRRVKLIMWTSSTPEDIAKYDAYFRENHIRFDFFNENPDVPSKGFGYFERKPYFNLMVEDKAGFDTLPDFNDWDELVLAIADECRDSTDFYNENLGGYDPRALVHMHEVRVRRLIEEMEEDFKQ